MFKAGVLRPAHEANPWINNFVLVGGKDKLGNVELRICLDPTNLNKVVRRKPYQFKTLEDIAHLLADAYIMSVCNCGKSYWHQELEEASTFLTTFNTDLGRFKYTVMPFENTVAGDVFQWKLDQCFGKIKQVIVITDDIMIVGKKQNHSNHDQALTALLEAARKCVFNWTMRSYITRNKKCIFHWNLHTIHYKADKNKFRAITKMPDLANKKEAQSFIGMTNYLYKFSTRLSEIVEPIRDLAKDKVPFNWGPEHQSAFTKKKTRNCKCSHIGLL